MFFDNKIFSMLSMAKVFQPLVFDMLLNPAKTTRILTLANKIKTLAANEKNKARMTGEALDLLVNFKKENKEDFEQIFVLLDKFLDIYDKNRDEVKDKLKEFFK